MGQKIRLKTSHKYDILSITWHYEKVLCYNRHSLNLTWNMPAISPYTLHLSHSVAQPD